MDVSWTLYGPECKLATLNSSDTNHKSHDFFDIAAALPLAIYGGLPA
jgi:hypothetical protein